MKKLLVLLAALLATTASIQTYAPARSVALDVADYIWVTQVGLNRTSGDAAINMIVQRARYRAWNELCFELRDIDCTGVPVAKVKTFEPNPWRPGLMGYYDGSDTVYIRNNLMGVNRAEVLAHEFSHYLDVMLLDLNVPGEALEICFSEKRAWKVSDNFWLRRGFKPNSKRIVGSEWTEWYDHCTPHQAVLYPDVYPK